MATLDSLQFEMERRVALYTWRTTMPDDTSLGYNNDPNLIVSPSTDGEQLLYNAPVSTRYATLDSSSNVIQEYFKQAQPSVWLPLGSGTDSSTADLLNALDASIVRIDSSIANLYSSKVDISGDTMTGDLTVPGVDITNDLSVGGNVSIAGDLTVDGSIVYVNTTELDISTNFINLNTGLTGTPPSWLQSGIVVERGDEDPYVFTFDETDDTFRIGIVTSPDASGVYNDALTQAVATRENNPISNAVAIWNDTLNRFDTSVGLTFSDTGLYVDGSIKISSLAGSGIRYLIANSDGTIDTSTISFDGVFVKEASIGQTLVWDSSGYLQVDPSSLIDSKNIGSGDASIYYGIDGGSHSFRELKASGPNIIIDVSDNLIILDVSIGGEIKAASIDGGVWITDIAPTGSGNVGSKSYSSDGNVLDYCLSDTSALTVSVLALPGHTNYKPVITINNVPVIMSESSDGPIWTGSYNIQYDFADASITAVHEDGASWSTMVEGDEPAEILSAEFTGGYPGTQNKLKENDTYSVNVVTDVSISQIIVDNYGAAKAGTFAATGTNNTITITIADRGTTSQSLGLRLRVVKSTGSTSVNYLTEDHGTVDGVDLVVLNNTYPSISFGTISYPSGQSALKGTESATVNHTITNYSTVSYTSPTSEIDITSPTTYQPAKNVERLSGGYNISTNNFRISATWNDNAATTVSQTVVNIANTPATLTLANPSARLRSGGNNGTSIQNHIITITANQQLYSAPSVDKDTGGTWSTSTPVFSGGPLIWTRTLQVHDNDTKGTYNWANISGTNLAGIVTTTNSGSASYTLGGFVLRTITVAAVGWQADINVEVSDYSKLSTTGTVGNDDLDWTGKPSPLTTRSTLGDLSRPQPDTWSASALFENPTTINILDKSATDSNTQATSFTIQEGI